MAKLIRRILVILALLLAIFGVGFSSARATDCNVNDAACLKAEKKEKEALANAYEAESIAASLETEVAMLDNEIATIEDALAQSETRKAELLAEIEQKETELYDKQTVLSNLLIDLHFESDASAFTLLAGSKTLAEYAEKQNRADTIKSQISLATAAVRTAKETLEEDEAKVEDIIAAQIASRETVSSLRAQQQSLVDKYQAQADAYNDEATAANKEKQAAILAYQIAHADIFSGSYYSGYNTYPWQADCPAKQDYYYTSINGHWVGGLVCECVSYVGWKAFEKYGVYLSWGHANNWNDTGKNLYVVNNTPTANSIGQFDTEKYGHVFWVESVNSDGSINVTEYNNSYATALISGSNHSGDFGARIISAAEAAQYNYIHLDQPL